MSIELKQLEGEPAESYLLLKEVYVMIPPQDRNFDGFLKTLRKDSKFRISKNRREKLYEYYIKYLWDDRANEFHEQRSEYALSTIGIDYVELREAYNQQSLLDIDKMRSVWNTTLEKLYEEISSGEISGAKASYALEKLINAREKLDLTASRRLGMPMTYSKSESASAPPPPHVKIIWDSNLEGGDENDE